MNEIIGTKSAGVRRKTQVRNFLLNREIASLTNWAQSATSPLRTLASLLFDSEPLIQWRAIEAMGMVAAKTSQKDIEAVRRQIRRLFWLMNDESGGLCWNAPEAIAEMIVNVPDLAGEYVPNLFSYMDEEPFEAGVRWAVHRLVREMPDRKLILDTASLHLDKIIKSLSHENPRIRAFAVLALKTLGPDMEPDCVVRLSEDKTMVPFYDMQTGILKTLTVSEFPGM